jgi:2-succinyl-5-enolpyruvyl-6-hydroxy-3-cyclohexene-1-carboxylate synthase
MVGDVARKAIDDAPFPNEPAITRTVIANCPSGTLLTVGSSMPVRDVDTYGGTSSRTIRFFGNRGTNGIDGVVSSALGTAASGHPAIALVGDVSLFHDLNALGTMAQLDLPLTIVVVNNNGGGIFHFLAHADPARMDRDTFETYLGTPHGTDFVAVGRSLGIDSQRIDSREQLAEALRKPPARPRLLELRTEREQNAALHRSIAVAVEQSVQRFF